jgi:hypothetical protein
MIIDKLNINVWTSENISISGHYWKDFGYTPHYNKRKFLHDPSLLVVRYEPKDEMDNSDLYLEIKAKLIRQLKNPFKAAHKLKILKKPALIHKQTVSRIDLAFDLPVPISQVLKSNTELVGRIGRASQTRKDSQGQFTWAVWGKAENVQICIYDKKTEVIENQINKNPKYAQAEIEKMGTDPLTRYEIRIGKRYLKTVGNDVTWVSENLESLAITIFEEIGKLKGNEKFNSLVREKIAEKEKLLRHKKGKYLESVRKYWIDRTLRGLKHLHYLERELNIKDSKLFDELFSKDIKDLEVRERVRKIINEDLVEGDLEKFIGRL